MAIASIAVDSTTVKYLVGRFLTLVRRLMSGRVDFKIVVQKRTTFGRTSSYTITVRHLNRHGIFEVIRSIVLRFDHGRQYRGIR